MDYQETLKIVKAQNPGMKHRDAQQLAKELYGNYKKAQDELIAKQGGAPAPSAPKTQPAAGSAPAPASPPRLAGAIPIPELYEAEKAIKSGPIDVGRIMNIGLQVIPDGKIVKHGKAANGVNQLVTFEDETGNRLPTEGFYEIFLL